MYIIYRILAKVRKLKCKLSGKHTENGSDWGYNMNGMVDMYCPNCLQIVRSIPLDDCPIMHKVLDVVEGI